MIKSPAMPVRRCLAERYGSSRFADSVAESERTGCKRLSGGMNRKPNPRAAGRGPPVGAAL
jgi:hypothetical protein